MDNKKIRIKLRSYDAKLVDKSTAKVIDVLKASGSKIGGPIPLPTEKEIFTILRSTHVNKKSQEQFEIRTHKRLIDIENISAQTIDQLTRLVLPAGVDIEIKL